MPKFKAKITVTVIDEFELDEFESQEDFKNRMADIYLHGAGEKGYNDKRDLGGDVTIEIIDE